MCLAMRLAQGTVVWCRRPICSIADVCPDKTVVPGVVLGILGYPGAAVLGETLFELVAGQLSDPERRLVVRI